MSKLAFIPAVLDLSDETMPEEDIGKSNNYPEERRVSGVFGPRRYSQWLAGC